MRGAFTTWACVALIAAMGQQWQPVHVQLHLPNQYYPNGGPSLVDGAMTGNGHGFWAASVYLSPSSGSLCWIRYTDSEWTNVVAVGSSCGTASYVPADERTVFYTWTPGPGWTGIHSIRMTDGGAEYAHFPMSAHPYDSYRMQPLDHATCMVVTRSAAVAHLGRLDLRRLTPQGDSEPMELVPSGGNAQAMAFRDDQTGIVALRVDDGPQEVWSTSDGGQNWQVVLSDSILRIRDAKWLDSSMLWLVGDDGLILSTSELGQTWEPIIAPASDHLYAIAGYSVDSVWVGGTNGMIHATGDGGVSWYTHQFTDSVVTRIHAYDGVVYAYTIRSGSPPSVLVRRLHKWQVKAPAAPVDGTWWQHAPHGISLYLGEGEEVQEL